MNNKILQIKGLKKHFGNIIALNGIDMDLGEGEVLCLLGDNGAGKSTLIKTLSGVYEKTLGSYKFNGEELTEPSPKKMLNLGIATVYQDLSTIPLMSVARNFFLGREDHITKGSKFIGRLDMKRANQIATEEMRKIGINIRESTQPVGTLSGGERQCLAISKAVYFGAKVLILDEPTSALGVAQASMVLKYILTAKKKGLGVIFITHNVYHAYAVGNRFLILNRGQTIAQYKKDETSIADLQEKMAGGKQLQDLSKELGQETSNL